MMRKLIGISSVDRNGKTRVPLAIRKMFHLRENGHRLRWLIHQHRVVVAPILNKRADYTVTELKKLEQLARTTGRKAFLHPQDAVNYLNKL
jgi:hypothetical protein